MAILYLMLETNEKGFIAQTWGPEWQQKLLFLFLGKSPISHNTDISMITNPSCSQNRTALYLNLLIMTNHSNYDCDKNLSEYWHTDS